MSCRPYPLAGNAPTGEVPSYPSSRVFRMGNSPCQVLAIHSPPGLNSPPHANSAPSSPPRAASSHSASLGMALPAQSAYAATSAQPTCTTGWSGLLRTELPGPCGCRQSAPGTGFHQLCGSARLTRCLGGTNTAENGTSSSGLAPGESAGSGARSATVAYPVLRTNRPNWRLVTGPGSIQNPLTVTGRAGASSG